MKDYEEKLKLLAVTILLSISFSLAFYFYFILKTNIVFSHFFYIPIILATLWWKKKGLIIPIFLAGILILFPIFLELDMMGIYSMDNFVRASLFIVIGIIVSFLSEQITKTEKRLKESKNRLKKFNIELEQRVEERTKELKKSEKEYREAYNRANFYKDLFTHDMNNILQNIQLSIEFLSQKELKERENLDELISICEKQVKRGARLILNVRKLSEIEGTQISVKLFEVYEVLEKAIEYINKSFQDRQIYAKIESSSKEYYIKANELLSVIFENILINAVKHNENPSVEILIKISEYKKNDINYLKLEFIDNGRGITDEVKEKIFVKSYIKDKRSTGMGLGLSLVKKIIEKYDGKIWVEDKIQGDYTKGSNFVILVPLA
jgi:signal transduction histidine kinase